MNSSKRTTNYYDVYDKYYRYCNMLPVIISQIITLSQWSHHYTFYSRSMVFNQWRFCSPELWAISTYFGCHSWREDAAGI